MSEVRTSERSATQAEWKQEAERHLTESVLPFWMNVVRDPAGGYFGAVDADGRVVVGADRSVVLNTRILWTFSAATRTFSPTYRPYADAAYAYLCDHFLDQENGGVFWMVNAAGTPVNTRKQIYAQAFALYAFAEYARAGGPAESLEIAKALFQAIETHGAAEAGGGYIEARDARWQPLADQRLSEKDLNTPKSMNTHLHVMEAYTNLLRIWRDPALKLALAKLLQITMDRIIDAKAGHFQLFFNMSWQSSNPHISYGHDIEGSWLLVEAAEVLGDPALKARAEKIALHMAEVVYAEGRDRDGSLFYEADGAGHMIDPNKHWWAQAESVVGFLNAGQMSGEGRYVSAARAAWDYIMAKVVDPVHGEWRAKLRPDGTPYSPAEDADVCLAGPWKCPYHNARCCLELISRL